MQYYVDINARRPGAGSKEHPFKTLQAAADIAMPGDEVLVAHQPIDVAGRPARGHRVGIARASRVMAECSALARGRVLEAAE